MKNTSYRTASYSPPSLRATVITAASALLSLLLSNHASALDYTLDVSLRAESSDNVNRETRSMEQDELETRLGTTLGVTHEGKQVVVDLNYSASASDYKNDVVQSDTQIIGNSNLIWEIIDESLRWNFNHDISETLANNRVSDARDNRETRQTFRTGPEYTARLSPVDDLILALEYTSVNQDSAESETAASRSNIDSQRGEASITWSHALSRASAFELGYSNLVTEFDNDSPDFEYQQLFVGYNVLLSSGDYGIRIGANRSERENQNDDQNGVYASANFRRDFGAHGLSFSAVRQLTDSSVGLDSSIDSLGSNNFSEIAVVERTSFNATYRYDSLCRGCTLDIRYRYDKEDFQQDNVSGINPNDDSEDNGFEGSITYRANSKLSSRGFVSYLQTDFDANNREDTTSEVGFSIDYLVTQDLTLNFLASYEERDTKIDTPLDLDYNVHTASIGVIYRIH
jgi:hypothetical protein